MENYLNNQEVSMSYINLKKTKFALTICILPMLLIPALTKADTAIVLAATGTGPIAARQAADQKAALAQKAAERAAKKAAEAQAAPAVKTETPSAPQTQEPTNLQSPVEEPKGN
jgi:pyruvate/2-oxoglutarate dehydrogenase complex dihydrolipoamide acyltransferase (E2) component